MDLNAFLKPAVAVDPVEFVVSKRFLDKNKNPVPFTLKPITQAENDQLIKRATKVETVRGQRIETMNRAEYQSRLVVACTVNPNFQDPKMLEAYGEVDPIRLPGKMLLAGEFANLANKLMEVNGFADDAPEQLVEEAKN